MSKRATARAQAIAMAGCADPSVPIVATLAFEGMEMIEP
jgi:hypothetical protein